MSEGDADLNAGDHRCTYVVNNRVRGRTDFALLVIRRREQ